jgi:hypothetical protein
MHSLYTFAVYTLFIHHVYLYMCVQEAVKRDGHVRISSLPVQRLPQPRFDMSSCCWKHTCVFAGGLVNLDGYFRYFEL